MKIAVTGPVAVGKSTVCRLFQEKGALVVSADELGHALLKGDPQIKAQVVQLLGTSVLTDDQTIDRKKVAEAVFNSPAKLEALERILHPEILREISRLSQEQHKSDLFVVEIPLLFETGQEKFFDVVIVVSADSELCRERLVSKGFTREEFDLRMKRQLPTDFKIEKADYLIKNNGSLENLREQFNRIGANLSCKKIEKDPQKNKK